MTSSTRSNRPKPLAGVRVLDLTRLLPGPMCTLYLADLGADVVKIEDTGAGDYARGFGVAEGETSPFFELLNRNKRAMRLDLKQPAGRDVLLRLARDADVLVESFRPGVMARLGVGYEVLAASNPRLVYCAITGFGQDGPYRDRAGHDINYLGYAGALDQIGNAGGPPAIANIQIADLLGGSLPAAIGILAALLDARATGRGRLVDVAMTDAVAAHLVFPMIAHRLHGHTRPRGEDVITGAMPYYNTYRTADGRYMAVGAMEPKFWDAMCDALARPDLKPRQAPASAQESAAVKDELARIFASRTQAEWIEVFAGHDCCVTPVRTLEEAMRDPQLSMRGVFRDDGCGGVDLAPPFKLSGMPFECERPAPAPGEHTDEILRQAGYDDSGIARLRREGVV
ncbi:MAG: CaiB/BaiF CoA transferase family protein [Pseudomonadota bacterium]